MPIWLLPIAKWLSSALGVVRAHPWPAVCLALCVLSAYQWHGKNAALHQLAAVHAAQKQATVDQVAVNHAPAVISQAIAEKSDVDSKVYYDEGRRAGVAYADAHRVPRACTAGPAGVPGTDSPAPLDDGPGIAPDMVAVTRADFDTLTGNSLRLAKVQQDAQSLIAEGVAVSER